jgi:glycosyltransferase involved in cell wall biosynthesis
MHYSIAISTYMKELGIAEGAEPENVFVLHNPVDMEKFYPGTHETRDVDVLFVGRLSREKGIGVLIEAAQRLSRETQVLIVGDGPLRERLERLAQGVQCAVTFEGWIENEMLCEYMRRAKVQVVPSLSEPQGLVVLEAMACGVPVIGTDTGGIPDMIKHGESGWLVPPNDAEALAKTIKEVLDNDREREKAGRAAHEKAQSFSTTGFGHKVVELYERIIERSPAQK